MNRAMGGGGMNARAISRENLQKIREAAEKQANQHSVQVWKRSWLELALAADKLDSMLAREELDALKQRLEKMTANGQLLEWEKP